MGERLEGKSVYGSTISAASFALVGSEAPLA